jgi:predicted nucleotidyltransferase
MNLSVVIYGSYAYGTQKPESDLDVLVVGECAVDALRTEVIDTVTTAQHRLEVPIDNEVPITVKILATWDDLVEAAAGSHFYTGGMPAIKPAEKTPDYLSSCEMCLRLWQNVLVGKVIEFTDRPDFMQRMQLRARKSMIALYQDVTGSDSIDIGTVVEWLIGAGDSDLWLGFRDCTEVREFLWRAFHRAIT